MNKFVSEGEIQSHAEKLATQTSAEREWDRVRAAGNGEIIGSATRDIPVSNIPSLFDQLKQKDEESTIEEEERTRNSGLPKMVDEDEARFFDEQRRKEREESRRLEMQLDQFKRAAALAATTTKSDTPIIPIMAKKETTVLTTRKIAPIAKLTPLRTSSETPSDANSKKRPSEDAEEGSPSAKKVLPNSTSTPAKAVTATPKIGLVKYNRSDDD